MNSIYVPMNGETGSSTGPKGKLQSRRIKSAIVKAFPEASIVFNANHYYCSCFIKFSEKNIVYLMTSDYRFFSQSYIVRSAKSTNDYNGGPNMNSVGFDKIVEVIKVQKHFNDKFLFVTIK